MLIINNFWDVTPCRPVEVHRCFGTNIASIFRVTSKHKKQSVIRNPAWKQYIPPKSKLITARLHGITFQKNIAYFLLKRCKYAIRLPKHCRAFLVSHRAQTCVLHDRSASTQENVSTKRRSVPWLQHGLNRQGRRYPMETHEDHDRVPRSHPAFHNPDS